MSKKFTPFTHTVLGSSDGNGRIEFIHANPDVSYRYSAVKSVLLADYESGQLVVLEISVSKTGRRHIKSHKSYTDGSTTKWWVENESKLKEELRKLGELEGVTLLPTEPVAEPEASIFSPNLKAEPTPTPTTEPRIYIGPRDRGLMDVMKSIAQKNGIAKVMFIGPSGYGKSSIPQQVAEEWGMNFLRWDCANVRDQEEFFGFRGAVNGSTQDADGKNLFTPSLFTETLTAGNAVIVLDELSRLDPIISNALFPLLDDAGKTNVAGHDIVLGDNIIFCATVNIGYQYTGTFDLDVALTNRFQAKVKVGPLPEEIEIRVLNSRTGISTEVAKTVVKVMRKLRTLNDSGRLDADASTRVSIAIAELLSSGLEIRDAIFYTIVSGLDEQSRKEVIDTVGIEVE